MKRLCVVGLVTLVACAALAGGNPNVRGYIDFDPPHGVHRYLPAPYEVFYAYVCFADLDMGLTTVSFMLADPMVVCPGVFSPPSFTNILPGDLSIGHVFLGITLGSTECMTDPVVCVGYLTLFYLGGECCIELKDHPEYPRWVIDCNDPLEVDLYMRYPDSGAVGAYIACPPITPVEDISWGSIKALYR